MGLLTNKEYDQIETDALSLIMDYSNECCFPLDIIEFVKKAFSVEVIKYSSLSKKEYEKIKENKCCENGFTVFEKMSNETYRYKIFYNDKHNIYKQRYTIAHELKHIFYNEKNPNEHDEEGAEYFAKVLLAPKCLIINKRINTVEEIIQYFGLSKEASENHIKGINNRINSYGYQLFDYEKEFIGTMDEIRKNYN